MRMVLTEIEKLDGRFPGLEGKVKAWFQQGIIAEEIARLLSTEYGVPVTSTMVENFRSRRWRSEKPRIALKKETAQAAVEAFGGDAGFDNLMLAKLWEMMDKMTIPQMLAARSLFVRIKAQNLKEQEFLFKTGQLKPPQPSEADREAQAKNALRRIKEIFGLAGDEPPKPPVRHLPPAAGGNPARPKGEGESPAKL